ncbi:MAG: hypothetical protein IT497_03285 [Ottowia sp.]|jgi:hypothetical protein|nr:hypothetical protein [Ottowia sp.]
MSKTTLKNLLLLTSLMLVVGYANASTGTEFKASADKFWGWISGEYGRMVALGGTGVGAFIGMVSKSFMPVLWGLGAAVALPLVGGIINSGFTAVL